MFNPIKLFYGTYKAYVGLIFVLTLCLFYLPLILLLRREKNLKKASFLFVVWSRTVQILIFLPFKIKQKAPIPPKGVILCANHTSYLDIFLMPSLFSRHPLIFVAKDDVLRYPLVKSFFNNWHIAVNRTNKVQSARSFVKIDRMLKAGWSVVIFPEGGIPDTKSPEMIPFKSGAFKLAIDNKVSIVPITFLNHYRLLSDYEHFFQSAHPGFSNVVIHAPIDTSNYNVSQVEELKEQVFNVIQAPLLELS